MRKTFMTLKRVRYVTKALILTATVLTMMFGLAIQSARADAPRHPLWPEGETPRAKDVPDKESSPATPTVDVYTAKEPNGAAVVVCPGGGYGNLAMGHEGRDVGNFFKSIGVQAFVLRYRHAPHYRHPVPMLDVQRAIRWVRAHAERYDVDPQRVGVMGFSAGGHLASTAATMFDSGDEDADDPIERHSCRPDFAILCYPVISFVTEHAHCGSRRNLLGKDPDPSLVKKMSMEKRVTKDTPPTFLFHTDADPTVPSENSVLFYLAMRRHDVPGELHVFRPGRHGVGLAPDHPQLAIWPKLLRNWMDGMGWLKKK